jgi:ATP-dependent Clp protease protease subunit
MNKLKEQIVDLLIDCGVKRTRKQILKDIDRDFWMNADEAIEYGLADKIITENILY